MKNLSYSENLNILGTLIFLDKICQIWGALILTTAKTTKFPLKYTANRKIAACGRLMWSVYYIEISRYWKLYGRIIIIF